MNTEEINKEIDELQTFLECDMWTKFHPDVKINGENHRRVDFFRTENDMVKYLREHFDVLRKGIKEKKQ